MKGRDVAAAAVTLLIYQAALQMGVRSYIAGPLMVLLAGLGGIVISAQRGKTVTAQTVAIILTATVATAGVLWLMKG